MYFCRVRVHLTLTQFDMVLLLSALELSATSTLIIPAMRRRTLGDRAFPVAATRARNSLPSFVRDEQSLAAF